MSAAAGSSLVRVCLHEYAHLAAARAFGACGFVRIRRIGTAPGEPPRFAGTFQLHGELGEREWRVVALAGSIAEWMSDAPTITVDEVMARLAVRSALPAQDAHFARGFDRADAESAVGLLRECWTALLRDAAECAADIESRPENVTGEPGALRT